eukprot:366197-Chlamydomonas_euryale.AAC.14
MRFDPPISRNRPDDAFMFESSTNLNVRCPSIECIAKVLPDCCLGPNVHDCHHPFLHFSLFGGFGTVQWLSGDEYVSAQPDSVVLDRPPTRVLQELTDTFGEKVGCCGGRIWHGAGLMSLT